jgi:hypothetical protein
MSGLERAIADACLGERAGEAMAGDLRGFLEAHGVVPEDVEAILAAPPRLAVYRSLVRNGLGAVVARMLPRTRARMNAACHGRFDANFARFLDEVGPRTHYLRDVPAELLVWAGPRWRADPTVPAYLPDLAAHEIACFAVAAAAAPTRAPAAEIALDRAIAFDESARLLRYGWAVHELRDDEGQSDGEGQGDPPARREVHLLAYRDADHKVRWLELTPLAASIVERLAAGETLGGAIVGACTDHDTAPAAVTADVARLLSDLGSRNVLLGGERIPYGR